MIYRFESSVAESSLDQVLAWSYSKPSVLMWRGRSDRPGQYRFDWRILVEAREETEFLLLFSSVVEFVAEPDYVL